jgi:hypothetical protein
MNIGVFSATVAASAIYRLPIFAGVRVCLRPFADFPIAMTLAMTLAVIGSKDVFRESLVRAPQ